MPYQAAYVLKACNFRVKYFTIFYITFIMSYKATYIVKACNICFLLHATICN